MAKYYDYLRQQRRERDQYQHEDQGMNNKNPTYNSLGGDKNTLRYNNGKKKVCWLSNLKNAKFVR